MQTPSANKSLFEDLGKQTKWFAFTRDAAVAEVFTSFVQEQHQESVCLDPSNFPLLFNWIDSGNAPLFVFIDISDMAFPYPELRQLIEKVPNCTNMIALGNEQDFSHIQQLKKMGIQEYLTLPITEERLMRSCFELWVKKNGQEQKTNTLIPIIGTRGNSGATTVAINAAYQWSLLPNQRVCLLDLDTQASDMALQLNIKERNSLSEALTEPERVDELFIKSILEEKRPNLFALTNNWSVVNPFDDLQITNESLHYFLLQLYGKVNTIFVDLSFPLNIHLMRLLFPHARCCFLVTQLSLSAARDTMRVLQWIKAHSPDLDVKIIANSSRPIDNLELVQESMEKSIGKKLDLILPYSKTELPQAVFNGDIFVEQFKKAPFAKTLASFVQAVALEYHVFSPEKKSWFQKLREWL